MILPSRIYTARYLIMTGNLLEPKILPHIDKSIRVSRVMTSDIVITFRITIRILYELIVYEQSAGKKSKAIVFAMIFPQRLVTI